MLAQGGGIEHTMIKKLISGVISALMLSNCAAFADSVDKITPDIDARTVSISGKLDSGAGVRVTLQVLNPGFDETDIDSITPQSFTEVFSFAAETEADSEGRFSFDAFDFGGKSGYYGIRVMRSDGDEPTFYPHAFKYISPEFEDDLLDAKDEGNMETFISDNISAITPIYEKIEALSGDVLQTVFKLAADSNIKNVDDASANVNRAYFFVTGDISAFENCNFSTDTPSVYFDEFSQSEKEEILKNAEGNTLADKTESFEMLCFFEALHGASGNAALESVIIDNESWHNIDLTDYKALSNKKSVNTQIADQKPDTLAELEDIILSALSPSGSPSGGGGGGGSSSAVSGRGGSSSASFAPTGVTPPQETTPPANSIVFNDISGYEWAKEAVEELCKKGIVSGTSENTFSPERNITRAEFVKLVCGAFLSGTKTYQNNFADVSAGDWFAPYVASAFDAGVVNGISQTEFGASLNITRQDMAVMIFKASKLAAGELKTDFADFDEISDYAKEAVKAMNSLGIINGRGNGAFCPKENATRAEAAQMIYKALKVLSGGDGV